MKYRCGKKKKYRCEKNCGDRENKKYGETL